MPTRSRLATFDQAVAKLPRAVAALDSDSFSRPDAWPWVGIRRDPYPWKPCLSGSGLQIPSLPLRWISVITVTLPFPALVIAGDMYVKAHIRAELEEQVPDLRVGRASPSGVFHLTGDPRNGPCHRFRLSSP